MRPARRGGATAWRSLSISRVGIDGIWSIQDDGTPGNGISEVRDPNGNLFQAFAHPADSITFLSRAGQSFNVTFVDGFATADITFGSLSSTTTRPDNIAVNGILAPTGTVILTANQAITELGTDGAADITADDLLFDAGTGIGTSGNPLEFNAIQLEGESITGGIYLTSYNTSGVTIGGGTAQLEGLRTTTSGDVSLVAQGSIALFEDNGTRAIDSAGNITLYAVGATANINGAINNDSLRAIGDMILSAGQDVTFGVTGANFDNDVTAGGSIYINAGRDFAIDGNADMAANDLGQSGNGGITISAGRNILIDDANGADASLGVTTGFGNVILTTGTDGTFTLAANSAAALFAADGDVTVNADRILIDTDSGISLSGIGDVHLTVATASRWIELGSIDDALPNMKLSDAEIDRIFANNVIIGSASIGHLIVNSGAVSFAQDNVTLEAGFSVQVLQSLSSALSLTLRAADQVLQTVGTISTGALTVVVDTPDLDDAGGISDFDGTVSVTSAAITGNVDADQLGGTAVNDTVSAGDGADLILLNLGGNDIAMGESGEDVFQFGGALTGADIVDGGANRDTVSLQGDYLVPLVLTATSLTDVERIVVNAGFSYDITTVDANVAAGKSLVVNGNGLGVLDLLLFDGSAESDGRFLLIGGDGDDDLTGGGADDTLIGGAGGNSLDGGGGNDLVDYSFAPGPVDVDLDAGSAADNGSGGSDTLSDIENVFGSAFNDVLTGDEFANIIKGGGGADDMTGGDGDDTYVVDDGGDTVTELAGQGFDTVRSSISYGLGVNQERLILTGSDNIDGSGNPLDNILIGNSGNNQLSGGAGADEMRGFDGDDTYVVNHAGDQVFETSPTDGVDTVRSSITYSLGSYLENLVLTGIAAIDGNGNSLVNSLTGNGNDNQLNGGQGADTMIGGGGDDTYTVDNTGDVIVETAGNGTDTVWSSADYTLSASIETLNLTGSAVTGAGNAGANTINGNNADNVLFGGGNTDTLFGWLGADTLLGDVGNDKLYGGAGNDDLYGGTGLDSFYFDAPLSAVANVDDILDFVAADDTIRLDRAIFTGIAADGAIGAAAFRLGTTALDADDRILYDSITGQVRYDADGTGGTAAILFATVTPGAMLTSADFIAF